MLIRKKNLGAAVAIVAAATVSVSLAAADFAGPGAGARSGSGAAKAPPASTGVREIVVEGTGVRVSLWTGLDGEGRLAEHYAISLDDGERFSPPRVADYTIKLRYDEFDPMGFQIAREVDPAFAGGDDTNLHIVQFVTQPLEAYRAAIRDLDGTIRAYLAHHAHIVEMTPETRAAVAALPFVRWIGPYHPAYRLEEFMIDNVADADTLYPVGTYNVRVFAPEQKAQLVGRVMQLGGVVELADAGRQLVRVTLTDDQLFDLARADEVMFIDRWGALEADMDIARQIGGAAALDLISGYDGAGVRGEVIDVGFNISHADFLSRPLIQHNAVSSDSHGAATSGIIFGDGTGNAAGKGLCHKGQGIVVSTSVMEGTSRYDNFGELVQSPYFAVFQSSSVGSPRTLVYNNESAGIDDGLFDFDFVLCQSQSNAGDQMSRPQAWAKNVISVGGVRHFDTLTKNDDAWNSSASIGPAADGRIKPDLCHFYDNIFTTTTGSSTAYTSSFGGTSGATPIVAGHVGLFMQMWADGIFGNPVDPFGTVFDNRPHATTCKAMMINTASRYGFSGVAHDLTRVHQGWGMPDLQSMYDQRFKMVVVDETDVLINLDSTTHYVDVETGEPALLATLVYADPGGTTSSSLHRINNLSLRVTSPGGTVYWGNNGLLEGNFSLAGGSENTIDTVENVFVQNPEAGQWTVEVLASEIVQDSHVETPEVDADYALVITGVDESLPPLFVTLPVNLPAIVDAGTPVDLAITINDGAEAVVPGSETLHYRFDAGSAFAPVSLTDLGGGSYLGTIPGASCGDEPQYYVSAQGDAGTVVSDPPLAQSLFESYVVGVESTGYSQDLETSTGWTVVNTALTGGAWEVGVPAGDGLRGDPTADFDGSGQCFLTQNLAGNSDVDGGPTTLTSELIDATGHTDPMLSYARWFTKDDPDEDAFVVELSDDDGASWAQIENTTVAISGWQVNTVRILDHADVTDQMRLRFSVTDNPNNSVVEAAVDAIMIRSVECDDAGIPGDVDGDGIVNFVDILAIIGAWGQCPVPPAQCPADVNADTVVNFADILVAIGNWTG